MERSALLLDEANDMLPTSTTDPTPDPPQRFASALGTSLAALVCASAFWATIVLPVVALALLATGVVSASLPTAVGFLALYGACAVAGHDHTPH